MWHHTYGRALLADGVDGVLKSQEIHSLGKNKMFNGVVADLSQGQQDLLSRSWNERKEGLRLERSKQKKQNGRRGRMIRTPIIPLSESLPLCDLTITTRFARDAFAALLSTNNTRICQRLDLQLGQRRMARYKLLYVWRGAHIVARKFYLGSTFKHILIGMSIKGEA